MLVHHSRNTASKQWDETLTLSLGRRRQTRAHFPAVASLDGFDERWDAFLDFFVHSVANGAKETSLAAISALQMTISSHASTPAMPPRSSRDVFERTPTRRARVTAREIARTPRPARNSRRP